MPTKIEWADEVWNPVTGCTKVSEGCKNCYAERIYTRFHSEPFNVVKVHQNKLDIPFRWKKPRRIFVCSMSDLFHEDVSGDFIEDVIETISKCPQHTFMVLTKRPIRMHFLFTQVMKLLADKPLPNLWLGVTAENQEMAGERIPILLETPAAVRFISVEPMLGPIDIRHALWISDGRHGVEWVICGAESGPNKRPFEMGWARDLKNQCSMANVPFFFKQAHFNDKLVKMPDLDGFVWDEYPEEK